MRSVERHTVALRMKLRLHDFTSQQRSLTMFSKRFSSPLNPSSVPQTRPSTTFPSRKLCNSNFPIFLNSLRSTLAQSAPTQLPTDKTARQIAVAKPRIVKHYSKMCAVIQEAVYSTSSPDLTAGPLQLHRPSGRQEQAGIATFTCVPLAVT
jgi:hypothetical protein